MIFLLLIVFALLSAAVSWRFKSVTGKYKQVSLRHDMTGAEIAEAMLRDNGIDDVKVTSTKGMLGDHYNPMNKTVNLSPDVYHERSVYAAAVAAHECGHAVQHAKAYPYLKFRSAMVPVQHFSSQILGIIIMLVFFGGTMAHALFQNQFVLLMIIGMQGVVTLFSLVTLPVEFDASSRGLAWLTSRGIVTPDERGLAKNALKWAAMTYVVAALSAIATLLYFVLMLVGGRRD